MADELRASIAKVADELRANSAKVADEVRALLSSESDAHSFMSPTGKQYEVLVDTKIDAWLAQFCGLEVIPASRRGIPSTDEAALGIQWDARFSVKSILAWVQSPSELFYSYGGAYERPAAIASRNLSPSEPLLAEYFAVLEYTRFPSWTMTWTADNGKVRKSLLPRLEERLFKCIQRAGAAGVASVNVLDIVAVVGVVGEDRCQESVEAILSKADCREKLLRTMFQARRLVVFPCPPMLPTGAAGFLGGGGGAGGGGEAGEV